MLILLLNIDFRPLITWDLDDLKREYSKKIRPCEEYLFGKELWIKNEFYQSF